MKSWLKDWLRNEDNANFFFHQRDPWKDVAVLFLLNVWRSITRWLKKDRNQMILYWWFFTVLVFCVCYRQYRQDHSTPEKIASLESQKPLYLQERDKR